MIARNGGNVVIQQKAHGLRGVWANGNGVAEIHDGVAAGASELAESGLQCGQIRVDI